MANSTEHGEFGLRMYVSIFRANTEVRIGASMACRRSWVRNRRVTPKVLNDTMYFLSLLIMAQN